MTTEQPVTSPRGNFLAIEADALQQVANYLMRRPWGEVNNLILALSEAKPVAPSAAERK